LLQEFKFTQDGWIDFVKQPFPTRTPANARDKFSGHKLKQDWQWSVFQQPVVSQRHGKLKLSALPSSSGAFLGHRIFTGEFTATAVLKTKQSTAWAGIAAVGDEKNIISLLIKSDVLKIIQVKGGKETELLQKAIAHGNKLYLQMKVQNGFEISFLYSNDGKKYLPVNEQPIVGKFLPPWDRAVRVGLVSKGETTEKAVFDDFQLLNK
jgi:beta-xylosidase